MIPALLLAVLQTLTNGSFKDWDGDLPAGWDVSRGAGSSGAESRISRGPDGGVALEGDVDTRAWRILTQNIEVSEAVVYRLSFEARTANLRLDRNQFNNCYVGLAFLDAAGNILDRRIRDMRAGVWRRDQILARAPKGAAAAQVGLFLSKTGRLEVRDVAFSRPRAEDSFDFLVAELDAHYAHFEYAKIDWPKLVEKHRTTTSKPEVFIEAILPMLAELEDMHVWIEKPGGEAVATFRNPATLNASPSAVERRVNDEKKIDRLGLIGRTKEGFAYLSVKTLVGTVDEFKALEDAVEDVLHAPGLILDLRWCAGGDERNAQRLASIFADDVHVYAKSKYRAGPGHGDFTEPLDRVVGPRKGRRFEGPVVCLIGPVVMSSGEGFALMMKSLPNVTLVGLPTRGASGNPAPVELPNGVAVYYSTWVETAPDGTPVEGRGIEPDVRVDPKGDGDPTLEAAIEELRKKIK